MTVSTLSVVPPSLARAAPPTAPTAPIARQRYDARALHLLDLDNLTGDPAASSEQIEHTWNTYVGAVPMTVSDHVVVASCGLSAVKAWWVLPATGIQRRVRNGADGADLALLDSIEIAAAARSFDRVVIASGDGIFTEAVLQLRAAGLHVHLVVGAGTPSRRLQAAATTRSRLRLGMRAAGRTAA